MEMSSTDNIMQKDGSMENGLNGSDLKNANGKNVECTSEDYTLKSLSKKYAVTVAVFVIITSYFCWATFYFAYTTTSTPLIVFRQSTCNGYGLLVILYCFYIYGLIHKLILKPYLLPVVHSNIWVPSKLVLKSIRYGAAIFYLSVLVATVAYLVFDTTDNRERLIPIIGLCVFVLIGFICSTNRSKIPWDTIIWGIILQFVFGLLTIRWEVGRNILECFSDKVNSFLDFGIQGAVFTYGEKLVEEYQIFAFRALSTIFFMSFMVNVLYYYGIMQKVVLGLGQFLKWIMGTSICESVNSVASVFLGMSEGPIILRPYLKHLTDSEIHSIMCAGFSTVSGSTLAAYTAFGARTQDLITASIMSAPAALCFSKLMYPETETIVVTKEKVKIVNSEYESVMDAASKGAQDAFHIVSGIISGLIAFLAFIYFANAILAWCGQLVGFTNESNQWSLELITGKIFIPLTWIMGIPWNECEKVGQLIGIKTMVNEFVAFQKMGTMVLTDRSKVIATYAICGFSNPGSIGIMISALGSLAPEKKDTISRHVFRAFFGGALVCLMTACIAGILMPDDALSSSGGETSTNSSTTTINYDYQ